ncbi:MAG: HlyD family efflux transporter periplasmic adaptor subunit [Synechococcales bacterium]|nr:HlyD family efflux transporter periplasmic adaptor subunit [Synechococcales bacterium]
MKVSLSATPAQSRQLKEQLAQPEDKLSYELGKAVQELPPLYTRLLAVTISVLTFSAIAWAHFSKVDEVAIAQGKLIPSTEVRPIRASSVASVSSVKVKAGDEVRKDDVLADMDPGVTETSVDSLEKDVIKIKENIARLEAESQGKTTGGNAEQSQFLAARQAELQEKQAAAIAEANRQVGAINEGEARFARFQENLLNARTTLSNSRISKQNAEKNLETAKEKESRLRTLKEQGAVPHLEYLNAVDQVTNASNQVTNASNQITEAENQIVTLEREIEAQQERIAQSRSAFESAKRSAQGILPQRQSEVLGQLTQQRQELTRKQGELDVAKKQRQERETIQAPFDGVVYNVKVTQGPVQQGEELLSILPQDEDLVLEVKLLNRDRGFIREGMEVKVKLATFPYQEFGTIPGEVIRISPDAIVERDEAGRELGPVFPAKVRLKKDKITVRNKEVPFSPGMAGTAEIITRKKSVLSFLIEPISKRFDEAFSPR